MGKLIKVLVTVLLLISIAGGWFTTKAEASTSQADYKLSAYNSKGKKVYVNAPKGMVVTKVSGKSWYKGSLKYTSYKKVSGKWTKYIKTSTIYVPSSKVKGYSKTTSTVKPVTTTKWVKKIKTVKGWFTDEVNFEDIKTGDIAKAGSTIMIPDGEDTFSSMWVENQNGEGDSAVTLEDAVLTQDPIYTDSGYANVKYVDYDQQKVTENKTVKTTKTTYKVTASTRAYTKIYVAPVKNGVTLSEYKKLKKGMTYQQVVKIIGENGKLEASYDGYGTTYKSYSWKQKGVEYAEASIDFENNKLTSMWQYGLE